jgi:adenosine deaminase
MPKVELHLHMEGAIPLDALWALIEHHGGDRTITTRSQLDEWFTYRDFAHFMDTWSWMIAFLRTYEDFEFAAQAFAENLASQNIRYAESFFSPIDFAPAGLAPQEIAMAIRRGLDRVEGGEVALIVDLVRDCGPENAARTLAEITEVAQDANVIGIGIGGYEKAYPPEPFNDVYRVAREAGFRLTAHAGEEAGPASVWGAITGLGVERVGHGVRSIEDPALVEYLVAHEIPLEVCPTSNLRTGVVAHWNQHPVARLIEAGVVVTINTDDPTMFDTTMAGEFATLSERFALGDGTLKRVSLAAVEASWADADTRQRLATEIEAWWASPTIPA